MDKLIFFIVSLSLFFIFSYFLDKILIKKNRKTYGCDDTCVHRCDVNCLNCKYAGFWLHKHDKDFKGGVNK